VTRTPLSKKKGKRSRSPGRFAQAAAAVRENVLAVGNWQLLLRCRLLGGGRRFGAHGGEGRGIPWRPPAYSLLISASEVH